MDKGGENWGILDRLRGLGSTKPAVIETKSIQHYVPLNEDRFQEFKKLLITSAGDNKVELTKIMQPGAAEKLYKDANYDETDEYYNMIKGALIAKIEHANLNVTPENLTKLEQKKVPLDIMTTALMSQNNDEVASLINGISDWESFENHTLPSSSEFGGGRKSRRRRNKSRKQRKSRR